MYLIYKCPLYIADTTVSVQSQNVVIAEVSLMSTVYYSKRYSGNRSWSYVPANVPWCKLSGSHAIGARYSATLKRNKGTWTVELLNNPIANISGGNFPR